MTSTAIELRLSVILIISALSCCCGQRDASLPLSPVSFQQLQRTKIAVPAGRSAKLYDVVLRHYGNSSTPTSSHRLGSAAQLLEDKFFGMQKPTVVYAHGYVELSSDASVQTVMQAYLDGGGYNVLLLDWSNLAFGNYVFVALDVKAIGEATAKALAVLLRAGLPLDGLHLVGHSLGAHVLAAAARALDARGLRVPRLTGLDPAYPGFYPAVLGRALAPDAADFVDVIHTDGGGYGAPAPAGHADYWPNGGSATQPGCLTGSILLTHEDFCSHWRSWVFWAESVRGGEFLARRCADHDAFLRGNCDKELVDMGVRASPDLKGNYYLRTAAKEPFALGKNGAA